MGASTLRRPLLTTLAAFAARTLLCPTSVLAQVGDPPAAVVRFIVPIAAGGGADRVSRLVAEKFSESTGVQSIVENRPGGEMIIAVQSLLSSPPDGNSILYLSPTPVMINPVLRNDLPYDAQRDIRPVAMFYRAPAVLVTGVESGIRSLSDLVTAARSRPGQVAVAHYTPFYRLAALQLARDAGVAFNLTPYKLTSQAINDTIGGTIAATFTSVLSVRELIRAGRLRAIAVTAAARHPLLPEVPTVAESGYARFQFYGWFGFGVHGRTPQPIVQRLEDTLLKLTRLPELVRFMTDEDGNEPATGTGAQFEKVIASETERYRQLIKALPRE